MELVRRPFRTTLFQGDYIGNAIGMRAAEVKIMGSEFINPEDFRLKNYYPPQRLKELHDGEGGRFSERLEENMEPELIQYCDDLVDRLGEILGDPELTDEEKATKITELHDEAKAKHNMDDILNWKEAKEGAERRWREGPNPMRRAA